MSTRFLGGKGVTVDRFLRDFLSHMGMTETLDCFQTEWTEMVQRGLVDTERVDVVPDVYVENQCLDRELRRAQKDQEYHRLEAATAAESLARLQRDRDLHRMHHKRVVQEKNRLNDEIRKLKMQCNNREAAVKRMSEKCQTVLQQTKLVPLRRDKVMRQTVTLRQTGPCRREAREEGARGTKLPVIQLRPTRAKSPRSQTKAKVLK